MSNELVRKPDDETKALAPNYNYGDDEGRGTEGIGTSECAIPFISLLQDLSPQVTEGDAKAGALFNTVSQETYPGAIQFIPAFRERAFIEWIPRDKGGGFVGRHDEAEFITLRHEESRGRFKNKETGNDIVETNYLYGMVVREDGTVEPAVISFTSTKITVYRRLMSKIITRTVQRPDGSLGKPPLYAFVLKVGSTRQKNLRGSFYNFTIDVEPELLTPTDPRFIAGRGLYELVRSGKAKVAEEADAATTEVEDGSPF